MIIKNIFTLTVLSTSYAFSSVGSDSIFIEHEIKESKDLANQNFKANKIGYSSWSPDLAYWGILKNFRHDNLDSYKSEVAFEAALQIKNDNFRYSAAISMSEEPLFAPSLSLGGEIHYLAASKSINPYIAFTQETYDFDSQGKYNYARIGSTYFFNINGLVLNSYLQLINFELENTNSQRRGHGFFASLYYYFEKGKLNISAQRSCIGDHTNCSADQKDYYTEFTALAEYKIYNDFFASITLGKINQGAIFTTQLATNSSFDSDLFRFQIRYQF